MRMSDKINISHTGSVVARVTKDRGRTLGKGVRSTSVLYSPVDGSGSSGVSPRRATTRTQTCSQQLSKTDEGVSLQQTVKTTKSGKERQRIKRTDELNLFIMRTYYEITELESNNRPFRNPLYEAFKKRYPDMTVTEQQIAGQRLAIVKNKYLLDT